VFWLFYVSKVFDYFDTLVIILRRKWRQLSFLHVYHHITIFLVRP
jgi:elongation of very long chain fatty acids protein 4